MDFHIFLTLVFIAVILIFGFTQISDKLAKIIELLEKNVSKEGENSTQNLPKTK